MRRLRIRRGMFGGANARRQRALNALTDFSGTNVCVIRHDLATGTYVLELPTEEIITLPKEAVVGFLAGFYSAAAMSRTLDVKCSTVTSLAEVLPELIETDD